MKLGDNDYPQYTKTVVVQAAQIVSISKYHTGDMTLIFDESLSPAWVRRDWVERHNPSVGGYYVILEDGNRTYINKEAFENGYQMLFGGK